MSDRPEPAGASELPRDWMSAVSVGLGPDGTATIEDFGAGRFTAAIETGELESRVILGQAPVEVRPGERASVVVPWDPKLLAFERTHLFGTLSGIRRAPGQEEWTLELARKEGGEAVFFRNLAKLSPVPGKEEDLAWDAGLVRAGKYTAEIRWIQYAETIDATKPGETQVALRLPPLTHVTVEIVDARTGRPVEAESADWQLDRRVSQGLIPIRREPRTGAYEFTSVAGDVTVRVSATGYDLAETKVRLEGRESRCRTELHPGTGIRVEMREGSEILSVGSAFFYGIHTLDEDESEVEPRDERVSAKEGTKYFRSPGRYRLEFPELAGYEEIAPRIVEVREGEVLDVKVDVRRAR